MKKIIFITFILFILFPLTSAQTNFVFKQSDAIDLKVACFDENNNFCNASVICNLTILRPNHQVIINNKQMTNNTAFYNLTLNSTDVSVLGKYSTIGICTGNKTGFSTFTFQVTKTGVELTQEKALVYIGALALLVFLFVVNIGGISMLPSGNSRDGEFVSISNLKYLKGLLVIVAYLLLIVIVFISSNVSYLYLETTLMGDVLFKIYQILFALLLPIIFVWLIWIFANIFQDQKFKRLIQRGILEGEGNKFT